MSMASALRRSVNVAHRQCRSFRTTALYNAAQNFAMPALSPTMTEGNIASWRVKEGDSFSAGDVLLEIETDKATMDVEAQDDGKLFKITQQDGSKGVKVGTRIAVLAEAEDDLSSLDVPAEDSAATSEASTKEKSPQEDLKGGIDSERSSESQAEAPPTSKSGSDTSVADSNTDTKKQSSKTSSSRKPSGKGRSQKYPLYPSVAALLKENGISKSDADSIPASGPGGRLLKGDVLSYVGKIDKDYSATQSARLTKLGHMDLSNIELSSPPPKPTESSKAETSAAPMEEIPADTEIALPISLSAAIAVQKRVQDKLHIRLPLSVLIQRASELANQDLPPLKRKPTAQDLFDAVLGVHAPAPRPSRGNYFPSVTSLAAVEAEFQVVPARKVDLFDEILGVKKSRANIRPMSAGRVAASDGVASAENLFSVVAAKGEEKRVEAYLSRMKLVLEEEPGRLVL